MGEVIRILHVIGSLNIGGSQTLIMSIYRNINREKIQFDFVINQENHRFFEKEILDMGGKVYYIPQLDMKKPAKFSRNWDKFFKEHKEYKIIHGHVRSTAAIYLRIARKNGRFAIAHSHNTSSGSGITAMIKNIMQLPIRYNADYFMACSDEAGKWLFGDKVLKKDNYHVLKNAIDFEKFSPNKDIRNAIRKEYNLEEKIVIGNVGRFIKQKNQMFLLEIFKQLHNVNVDARLLMVGYGEMQEAILKRIEELKLEEYVLIPKDNEAPEKYLQAMDVFVFPSLYEGLGISLVEAQAVGLPCVVANTIPNTAIISDNVEVIGLDSPIEYWVDKILLQYANKNTEYDKRAEQYDLKKVTKWLEDFYLERH